VEQRDEAIHLARLSSNSALSRPDEEIFA